MDSVPDRGGPQGKAGGRAPRNLRRSDGPSCPICGMAWMTEALSELCCKRRLDDAGQGADARVDTIKELEYQGLFAYEIAKRLHLALPRVQTITISLRTARMRRHGWNARQYDEWRARQRKRYGHKPPEAKATKNRKWDL